MVTLDFRNIVFGKTDASAEREEYPKLLLDGYFDVDNVVHQATGTNKFLFLGRKGSGKTALSEHLSLKSNDALQVEIQTLNKFPYKNFSKIISGDSEAEVKARKSWRWLLLVKALSILMTDSNATTNMQEELVRTVNLLTQAGLFPVLDIAAMVSKSSTNTFKASIQCFSAEHSTTKENAAVSLEMMIDYVEKLALSFRESVSHLLIIDGLDDILTTRDDQYIAIAALINEVKELNQLFSRQHILFKVIVLCRTDIFERLPDPNKNKLRRDNSYDFNWYQEGTDSQKDCGLIKIANIRAQMHYSVVEDVFEQFFPSSFHNSDTRTALLEMTRHTPRDFMQLLVSIQNQCRGCNVTMSDIEKGFKDYSNNYFVPEIKDEMAGYIPVSLQDPILHLLASFHKREIPFLELDKKFRSTPAFSSCKFSAQDICNVLYDCSAIGQIYQYGKKPDEVNVSFKYRNIYSSFNPDDKIFIHKGLKRVLDLH